MNGIISTKYLVAHQLEGGEEARESLLTSFKTNKIIPDSINIEGVLMDDSTNLNNWQVPESELDYIINSIVGAPYLKDHDEKVDSVAGQVTSAWKEGNIVKFRAEIDEPSLIKKMLKGTVKYSSVQVDSDKLVCSACYESVLSKKAKEEDLIKKGEYYSRSANATGVKHLHKGAHEVVLKPEGKEISAVVFPAYKNAEFKPVMGFAAAMNKALGLSTDKENGVADVQESTDIKQNLEANEKTNKMDEKQTVSLTAAEIASGVLALLDEREKKQKAIELKAAQEEQYSKFMSTFETAVGKIKELEGNYQAGTAKLEELLKKFETITQKQEEISAAGKTLNEAKKKEFPPEERPEGDAGDKDVCPECGKKECKHEKKESVAANANGKGQTGQADGNTLRTGVDSKMIPGYFKELMKASKKNPRTEA